MTTTHQRWMQQALSLAERGLIDTDPNPTVGCVIVNSDELVGAGWTSPAGGPHAERVALAQAGARARGATVYVTLEPCCHTGRTGPCTDALIEAGVEAVVIAVEDPNPDVAGSGTAQLRAAGIAVTVGICEQQAQSLNQGFFSRMLRGRPWLRCKIAASLDGRVALANGRSQWITSPAAREDVHRWRARSSVVMTGIGTVLADNPSLNARPAESISDAHQPARVILDSTLRLPNDAQLITTPTPVRVYTSRARRRDDPSIQQKDFVAPNVSIHSVAASNTGQCDLSAVLRDLGEAQFNDVWVEAGSRLNGALLEAGLIDELIVYTAPVVLGVDALGMFDIPLIKNMEQRFEFDITDVQKFGPDLRVTVRPVTVPRLSA